MKTTVSRGGWASNVASWRRRGWALFGVALIAAPWAMGCGAETSGQGAGGERGDDTTSGAGTGSTAARCTARCEARATSCGQPVQVCGDVCAGSPSSAALDCLEALPCSAEEPEVNRCLQGSATSATASTGGAQCVALGESGCSTTSPCCGDGPLCTSGKCCAAGDTPCTKSADCCFAQEECLPDPNKPGDLYCRFPTP